MDRKKLILAVAGSGKTYFITRQLDENKRYLLITFTISGTENLINEVINRFGYLPKNIKVYNFFSFLYSFCYKPYFKEEYNEKGIYWNYPKNIYNQSYLTQSKYLYHNRISKLICEKAINDVKSRLEKYFDYLMVDEIQDFGGNDFNFLLEIVKSNLEVLFVGDFYQHTFDTSRDKQTNKSLHYDFVNYVTKFTQVGITIDNTTLIKSRRCTKTTCEFIKSRLGIEIEPEFDNESECKLITEKSEAEKIFNDDTIVKLFLQKHYNYKCKSDNWGACKGLTYENVCVVINNDTYKLFNSVGLFNFKSSITKNKFYVACSRTRNNLYFIKDSLIKDLN